MTKEEILNYVMHTPYNTNRAILEGMIDELATSSGTTPTGTVTITQNGTNIDVSQYATANVNVPISSAIVGEAVLGE